MKTKLLIFICLICCVILTGCHKTTNQDKSTVCLFFDDGWMNQYEEVLPVLLEYDFKATFGIITDYIGTGQDIWEYMGIEELNELSGQGMEIACHTRTHHDLTDNLTDTQLLDEIVNSKSYLEDMGFEIETFIYPYNEWDERVIEFVKTAGYNCARGGWQENYWFNYPLSDDELKYHLPSWSMSSEDLETFKSIFSELGKDSVICLVYHFVTDDNLEGTAMPIANFHEQMTYLKEAGFKVVLISDLFK